MRNLQYPGRSPVYSANGMAATSHPLSTQAAIDILKKGGNALDAAIAACAVQCVVEPGSTGIGGDCFCLYAPHGNADEIIGFNGSGRAPKAAKVEWYLDQGIRNIERQSPHAVTIPGAIDAWCQLNNDHGVLSLREVLSSAISYAREGFPLSPRVCFDFETQHAIIKSDSTLAQTFLVNDNVPKVGTLMRQPLLAQTLEVVAEKGREGFYSGDIMQDMVRTLQEQGGLHTQEDFVEACGEYVVPISCDFHGYQVYQCPPNSQGIITLLLLNTLAGFELDNEVLSVERIHKEIEIGRLAYQDRFLYVSDPAYSNVPVEWMLSEEHAKEMRAAINLEHAMEKIPKFTATQHKDTVYITVVDSDRNVCSFINSLFYGFGSGIMTQKSGVLFNNRGTSFSLNHKNANCIESGKRPMHTLIPGLVSKNGNVVLSYGVMGGHYQAFGHMQLLSRLLDYEYDIQEVQDLPRWFPNPITGEVQVEDGISDHTKEELLAMGHNIVSALRPIGGSQAISIDWQNGVLSGGSDPRKDGCAIGY